MDNIGDLVRRLEQDDMDDTTTISKYVGFNQRENLDKIDAYLNSKHISGETDSQEREKPFFNIVTAATNIWYRATDIDRKNIRIVPAKSSDEISSFLATIHLQEWMRKQAFGRFLNDWGLSLARYGSTILKFVEKKGELHSEVMPWANMIVDPVDFDANPKIEKLWLTPAQLLNRKGYDKKFVLELIDAVETRETPDGQDKDDKFGYIPIYEIHGELPLSYLTEEEKDDKEFVQQMHVISYVESKETDNEYDDYTLASGREKKDPYLITHLIEADGRTQSIGAVEHLFQAQWMQNHSVKTVKDNLDMASKIIFQTSDGNFVGKNALTDIEQGDILTYSGNPLTQLNNRADITAHQEFQAQWKQLGNEITGISEAMLGAAPKSGTAWRQTEALLQESHSLFEMMTENKGLYIKEMLTKYIIPYVKKQMDTKEEIMPVLEAHQLEFVDAKFIPNEAIRRSNQKIKNAILSGGTFTREEQEADIENETKNITDVLNTMGNRRGFKPSDVSTKTWKEVFKDLEWDLEYEITGESRDSQVVMDTLTRVLQFIGNLQGRPMSPEEKLVFNKILSTTGAISPMEISQVGSQQQQPVAPVGGAGVETGQPTLEPTQQ